MNVDVLSIHGRLFRTYTGKGSLTCGEGTYPCAIRVGQVHSGKVVLVAECPVSLPTAFAVFDEELALQLRELDGRPATVRGAQWVAVDTTPVHMPGPAVTTMTVTFLVDEVVVQGDSVDSDNEIRFYLTNLPLLRSIMWTDQSYTYRLSRMPDYKDQVRYRKATGETAVTACLTLHGPQRQPMDLQAAEKSAANLCSLLSLAVGSTVAWVMSEEVLDGSVRGCHRHPAVSASKGTPVISPMDLECYLVGAIHVYEAQHHAWNLSWAIRLFTDAVSQGDHLEMRTLKLVTLMEHLAGCYSREFDQGGYLIPPDRFNAVKDDLKAKVKDALKELLPELSSDDRRNISLHVSEFSRRTFDHTLKRMARHLKLKIAGDEWVRFVSIRNHIVHQARFPPQGEGRVPWDQYRFVLSLVTRIMLAILNYNGCYFDWTKAGGGWESEMRVPMTYVVTR